jgi:hypothetical protein
MDEQLVALVQSVEAGNQQGEVTIRVFLAGGAVQGVVQPSDAFADLTEPVWVGQLGKGGWGKRNKEEARQRASAWVEGTLRPLRDANSSDGHSVLTLGPATFWPFGGKETVELPAIRIALESVEAWCFLVGKVSEDKGGGFWFVGGSISDPF